LLQLWKDEIWPNERRAMRLLIALAATFITISVGYAYAGEIWVSGWQLWTWLVCILATVIALLPARWPSLHLGRAWWARMGALLLVALLLRVTFLGRVPGGLHVDEVGVGSFALGHVFPEPGRTLSPFRTGPASQPALHHYLIRLTLAVVGNSIAGLRISSVLAGVAAVAATYGMVAVLQNRRTAWLSAIFMAIFHYHIHWSRIGLNNVWDTLWVPLMLGTYAWGWKRRWSGGAVLSGLAVGLSQYFYAGSKLGLFVLAYLIFRLWQQERDQQRLLVHTGKLLLTAVCVAAPLILFALRDPQNYFQRPGVVFGWQRSAIVEATGGDVLAYAWRQLWRTVGAFTSVPDITGFYGPGVPLVIGVAAPLFVVGLLWAVRQRQFVPVLWVLLTIFLGGFMLTGAPSSSHYVVSIPAISWLVALPLMWLIETGHWRWAVALLIVIIVTDLGFYFGIYVPGGPRDLIHPFPTWPPP
jgi:4-amino-4-deoxy-L-arabinose transferase-like glycosyltransferase